MRFSETAGTSQDVALIMSSETVFIITYLWNPFLHFEMAAKEYWPAL